MSAPTLAPPATPTAAPEPRIQPGDVILYPAQPGDAIDTLICEATHGPFSHTGVVERVEVSPGDGALRITTIEALSRGVTRVTFPLYPSDIGTARIPTYVRIAQHMEPLRIAHGLGWTGRQVGKRYGWLDIAADVVKAALPRRLGSRTPFLVSPSSFDCSALVAKYLLAAGYEWLPDEAIAAPERVSPNDIARMLGVIKP